MSITQATRPDLEKLEVPPPDKFGPVPTWSYSALKVFEECPYRTFISRVRKIPEPSSPAADRGSKIHQEAEDFVKGELGEMPDSLKKFEDDFHQLRHLFAEAKVELEGEWGFNIEWKPVGWMVKDTWARIKLDALVHEDESSVRVIDYKTGKRFGNEISHNQQCLLYAIGTFFRYPHVEFAQTELWYLDKGEKATKTFTREQAMNFAPSFYKRAIAMTTCEDFAPTPSKDNCRWCSYRKGDDPECQWGVS